MRTPTPAILPPGEPSDGHAFRCHRPRPPARIRSRQPPGNRLPRTAGDSGACRRSCRAGTSAGGSPRPSRCWSFAMVVNSVVRNDAFQWDVVGRYFTTTAVLRRAAADPVADRGGHGARLPARHPAGRDAAVRQPGAAHAELGLRVDLPLHAAAGPAAVLVQHRRPLPDARPRHPVRPAVRHRQDGQPARPRPHRRHRPDPARGRLRRRGGARRHPLRGPRPDRGRPGARAGPVAHAAPDRRAAGDALHRADRRATC